MIAILDTNALHGDVFAAGQSLTTLFDASDSGLLDDVEIWTPRGVVEELVRQYPARLRVIRMVAAELERELDSFRIARPDIPGSTAADVDAYREQLSARLSGAHRKISEHPATSATIVDWAAARRKPIKGSERPPTPKAGKAAIKEIIRPKPIPLHGVVDAAVWLTVIEAAKTDTVALITANSSDFANPEDPTRPCEELCSDLDAVGVNPDRVAIYDTPLEFNKKYVEPLAGAQEQADAFFADAGIVEVLKAEVVDAVEWFPMSLDSDLGVEIDDSRLVSFEVESLDPVRADPAPEGGLFLTVEVAGSGTFDLGIRKGDANYIPEQSPITVYDWDWNESMVAAEAELEVWLLIEARITAGEIMVSVEESKLL